MTICSVENSLASSGLSDWTLLNKMLVFYKESLEYYILHRNELNKNALKELMYQVEVAHAFNASTQKTDTGIFL